MYILALILALQMHLLLISQIFSFQSTENLSRRCCISNNIMKDVRHWVKIRQKVIVRWQLPEWYWWLSFLFSSSSLHFCNIRHFSDRSSFFHQFFFFFRHGNTFLVNCKFNFHLLICDGLVFQCFNFHYC